MFQFTINAKELNAIQALDKIANTNTSAMHLQKMLVEVDENAVRLTTSNPEARMTATLHVAEIEGSGKILVEPKTLGALARAIGEMPMKLAYNDGVDALEISTPNGKYSLNAYDATDYPQVVSAAGTTYYGRGMSFICAS